MIKVGTGAALLFCLWYIPDNKLIGICAGVGDG